MNGETVLNNRYALVAQQGAGGMAVIYKARDQLLGRTVAIKSLRPSLTTDPAFIARFQNEARAIANLQHPNIVTVHDVGMHTSPQGTIHYIVMEFVEGQDLKKVIKTENALDVDRALDLAIQICDGIGYAHRAGIVHADVKPQNVLITRDGKVKVTDFGIAQALSDTQPQQRESVVWGSPHYFSPEQARGERPSAAADVYSIGIVLFEMLTGRLPYLGTTQQELAMAHIKSPVPLITEYNPALPEKLAQIVARTMAKEPNRRYSIADQLGSTLRAYRDQGGARTANVSTSPRTYPQTSPTTPPPPPTVPPETVPRTPSAPPTLPQTIPQQPARPYSPPPTVQNAPVSMPTERAPIAPEAPGGRPPQGQSPVRPVEPLVDRYNPSQAQPQYGQPQYGQPPYQQSAVPQGQTVYDPAPYPPRQESQQYRPLVRGSAPPVMDAVTIILAILAFFAVICLIPLYIFVAQAYLGG